MAHEKMTNCQRLIDANALIAEYDRVHIGAPGGARKLMVDAPTVDAVEVVHGKWVDRYGGKYANPAYDCSVCKKSALFRNDMDLLGNWKSVQYLSDFCPNCAARMDGGNCDEQG